jgi:uncharacterized protein YxjI
MRYTLKERIFSLRESYYIQDETGQNAFEVRGKLLSLRDALTLHDLKTGETVNIHEKMLSLRPVYMIERPNQPDVAVRKDFINFLREGFTIDLPGNQTDLRIQGNILDMNYTITRDGATVAQSSKKWISLRDSYVVDIAAGEDPVLIIACALILDRMAHEGEEGRS